MTEFASYHFALGGDPTFYGWFICFAYLVTSWYCFRKGKQFDGNLKSVLFWMGLALLMLILGLNKQLDLQTFLVNIAKVVVKDYGLYMYKRQIQHALVATLAFMLILTLIVSCIIFAEAWHRFKLAWLGIFVLFSFVFLRVAYFNRESQALIESVDGYYQYLEFVGIVLIFISTYQKPDTQV